MVKLKSLFLGFFTFLFLSLAFTLLFAGVMLFKLPGDVQDLKVLIKEDGSEIIAEHFGDEFDQMIPFSFEELQLMCTYMDLMPSIGGLVTELDEETQQQIEIVGGLCEKINSGEINSMDELKAAMIQEFLGAQLDEMFEEIEPQINEIHSYYPYAFVGFFFLYFMGALFIYLDKMHVGEWIKSFSTYNLILTLPSLIILGIFYLSAPQIVEKIAEQMVMNIEIPFEIDGIVEDFGLLLVKWVRGVIIVPIALYFLIGILSIVGIVAGFIIPKKIKKKK